MSLELFAKLIASENISLQRGNYQTASFDLISRTVFIPTFVNMTAEEELCLVFHEVGHALFSDNELLAEVIASNRNYIFKQYLNVVEDARIERKTKERYPGSKKSFYDGYTGLNNRNFFGTKTKSVDLYSFIDRLNIWAKLGDRSNVKFSAEEMSFVQKSKKIQTPKDAINLAKAIYNFAQSNKAKKTAAQEKEEQERVEDEQQELELDEQEPEEQTPPEQEPEDDQDGGADKEQEPEDDQDGGADKEQESEEEQSEGPAAGQGSDDNQDGGADQESEVEEELNEGPAPDRSVSTEIFEDELSNNIDKKVVSYVDPVLSSEYFYVSFKEVKESIAKMELVGTPFPDKYKIPTRRTSARRAAGYLHREFEMRKAAFRHARTLQGQSGTLDSSRLFSYKTASNLFKKYDIVADGQNHGIMILLDVSGSMGNVMSSAIQEIYSVVAFAKMAGIPFNVVAFSSINNVVGKRYNEGNTISSTYGQANLKIKNTIAAPHFALYEIANSDSPFRDVEFVLQNLMARRYGCIEMNSTPLIPSLLVMRERIPVFREKHNLQKLSFVVITDGVADSVNYLGDNGMNVSYQGNVAIRHKQDVYKIDSKKESVAAIMSIIQKQYSFLKTIGYFIVEDMSARAMRPFISAFGGVEESVDVCGVKVNLTAANLRATAKDKVVRVKIAGFHEMLIFVGSAIDKDFSLGGIKKDAKPKEIAAAFSSAMRAGVSNKVVLSTLAATMG